MSYATDLADAMYLSACFQMKLSWLPKELRDGATELRRLAAENESLVNALACIEGVALADDPRDLAGIASMARAAIASTTEVVKP